MEKKELSEEDKASPAVQLAILNTQMGQLIGKVHGLDKSFNAMKDICAKHMTSTAINEERIKKLETKVNNFVNEQKSDEKFEKETTLEKWALVIAIIAIIVSTATNIILMAAR